MTLSSSSFIPLLKRALCVCGLFFIFLLFSNQAEAATLRLSPDTGVYTVGQNFTVRVLVNTQGQSVNASDATLKFNPSDLRVISASRSGSIFNLWTQEPTFSNSAGTITFGGGAPSGYTGSSGNVITVTFRPLHAGTFSVSFTSGSVLAADGRGTNVITDMKGGSYTVGAATAVPEPEYIAPPNTPAAPRVTSETHPDPNGWYQETTARLAWSLPSDVTGVRTLLDSSPGTIPTKVYETPISELEIEDLDEGVSYLHIQFRNAEGWGRVAHYRLGVDKTRPTSFEISHAEDNDVSNAEQRLFFDVKDEHSGVNFYKVQINGGSFEDYTDEDGSQIYTTPSLDPGEHSIVVEAFDRAGNSIISSFSFEVIAFSAPRFTEYPSEINEEVIPVIKGETKPDAQVEVTLTKLGTDSTTQVVQADGGGIFTFIPESRLSLGVYELSAVATDQNGAKSDRSEVVRIAVQEPGFVRIGSFAVNVLSVLIPLVALLVLLVLTVSYGWTRLLLLRKRVRKEATEAEHVLAKEFNTIVSLLKAHVDELKLARKGKLTKAESAFVHAVEKDLAGAEKRVRKEIVDIEKIVD